MGAPEFPAVSADDLPHVRIKEREQQGKLEDNEETFVHAQTGKVLATDKGEDDE